MGSLGGWCLSRGGPRLGVGLRENDQVTMGRADRQGDLFDDVVRFCEGSLPANSIYGFLARERDRLFPDELFADLFSGYGSAVGAAVGGGHGDGVAAPGGAVGPGGGRAVRLRRAVALRGRGRRLRRRRVGAASRTRCWSTCARGCVVRPRPNRIFEVGLEAAHAAGLVGRRRVLDSTPLYDAVATMDTVTLIRSAVRGLLAAADADLAAALRAALSSGDDYAGNGKPQIDWDDPAAREELIDSRARDGFAVLALLDGRELAERGRAGGDAAGHGAGPGPGAGPGRRCSGSPGGSPRIG